MSDFAYNPQLIQAAHLRFSLDDAGKAVAVTMVDPPADDGSCRICVEQAGRPPRHVRISLNGDTSVTAVAAAVSARLSLTGAEPSHVREHSLEPVLPPLLELSPASPCYADDKEDRAEMVEAVIAFADLRGFSSWSQGATPQEITALFDVVADAVSLILAEFQYDYWKLLGDGVMLVWRVEGDARLAVSRAIGGMKQLVRSYGHYRAVTPGAPDGFGAAICTGPVIEFASSKFFDSCRVRDYLGPVVNLAARLQGLADADVILLDRDTAMAVERGDGPVVERTSQLLEGLARLKGVDAGGHQVYELMGPH